MVSIALAVLLNAIPTPGTGQVVVPSRDLVLDRAPRLQVGGSAVLAADDFGRIYRSSDSGRSWEPSFQGLPVPLTRRAGEVLLAGDPGRSDTAYALLRVPAHSERIDTFLFRSTDGGRNWIRLKEIPHGESLEWMVVRRDATPVIELSGNGHSLAIRDTLPLDAVASTPSAILGAVASDLRLPGKGGASIADSDQGNVAVLHDDGTFVAINDLDNRSIMYSPQGASSYAAAFVAPTAISGTGVDLAMADDEKRPQTLPFSFPFFGTSYTDIFISSNGNITFGTVDPNPDNFEQSAQFASGPPRIAPLWDDWAPDLGGQVFYDAQPTRVTITWLAVTQYFFPPFSADQNTFQIVLDASGTITVNYGAIAAYDGLTGFTPGGGATLFYSDLTLDAPWVSPPSSGVYEWYFSEFWTTRVAQRFFHCHADSYDQIIVWGASDYPYVVAGETVLAFADVTRNEIQGLGIGGFDQTAFYGSAGVLRSVVNGGNLLFYPLDPNQNFQGDANALDVIAQQVGQQWGSYVTVDRGGVATYDLLGRSLAHWNFFFDTDASDMEGNLYRDNLDGTFTTVECDERYSPIDQYLMGLIPPASVPDSYLIDPVVDPGVCLGSFPCARNFPPEVGVTVTGTRTPITIAQITSPVANGPRLPATAGAPTPLRMAWVLVVPPGSTVIPGDVAQVEAFRTAFGPYFQAATATAGTIDSALVSTTNPPTGSVGNNLWLGESYNDVILDWRNGPTTPRRYVVHTATSKLNLGDTNNPPDIGTQPVLTTSDSERVADRDALPNSASRPSPFFYEVFGRDCIDVTVFP